MTLNTNSPLSIRDQWARQHAIQGVQEDWNHLVRDYLPSPRQNPLFLDGDELPPAPTPPTVKFPFPGKVKIINVGIIGAGAGGLFTALVLDFLNIELAKRAMISNPPCTVIKPCDESCHKPCDKLGHRACHGRDYDKCNDQCHDPYHNPCHDPCRKQPVDFPPPECPRGVRFRYDILEAGNPARLGGRLYTHDFGGPRDTHDYYDVGAMRFPDNPVMTRTFDLFAKLGMNKTDLKSNPDAVDGSIIPYYMKNGDTASSTVEPWSYNDITKWGTYNEIRTQSADNDPFEVSTDNCIPAEILKYSPDDVMKAAIEPFREALKKDATQDPPGRSGWDLLMKYDTFSTREYLATGPPEPLASGPIPQPPYNYDTIEWMETFNGGTNWYDQAYSETVLESLDFEFDDDTKWYCILGGAQQLAQKMEARLLQKDTIHYSSPVTTIRAAGFMNVQVDITPPSAPASTKSYHGVINTTTLGCLKRMDLRDAGLSYGIKQATRSLGYGPAAKVAIKFKRAWWIHDLGKYNVKMGGLGHSDLNSRICVYPSYNIYDDKSKTAVLLCSYTWQQDSERLSSLMSTNEDHVQKVKDEAVLKALLIRDLARLHANDDTTEDQLHALISDSYIDHHAWDWDKDPNSAGAFAFFRPQQFSSMWGRMIWPSSDVVIAGEAASPHHAWVVGALESVVHGLHAWLGMNVGAVPEFAEAMDILETEEKGNPFVGLPPYMDPNISRWHSFLGIVRRFQHLRCMGLEEEQERRRRLELRKQHRLGRHHDSLQPKEREQLSGLLARLDLNKS